MATQVTYVGDGSTITYAIPFDYAADGSDLNVTVDGEPVPFTLDNASTMRLQAPPAAGLGVRVFRKTPFVNPAVVFADSSILSADDLNGSAGQLFRKVEEVSDDATEIAARALMLPEGKRVAPLVPLEGQTGILTLSPSGDPVLMHIAALTGAGTSPDFNGGLDGADDGASFNGGIDG